MSVFTEPTAAHKGNDRGRFPLYLRTSKFWLRLLRPWKWRNLKKDRDKNGIVRSGSADLVRTTTKCPPSPSLPELKRHQSYDEEAMCTKNGRLSADVSELSAAPTKSHDHLNGTFDQGTETSPSVSVIRVEENLQLSARQVIIVRDGHNPAKRSPRSEPADAAVVTDSKKWPESRDEQQPAANHQLTSAFN
ncbi:unnamed protein product, partial [Mesorhabditis spiculigera]